MPVDHVARLSAMSAADHPENRPETGPEERSGTAPEPGVRPIGFGRALAGMWLGGAVGSLLTLMTVAYPLGAGDTTAAFSVLPLALMLIAIVNGWIAANLFLDSGLHK